MIKVKIPATSANIGPGFDSIGLAVNMYNYVTLEEYDGVMIESLDGTDIPRDETNLVYTTAKSLYEMCGITFHGLKIGQISNIPFTRGLGSSSACIIGGLKGANKLMGNPVGDDELINIAAVLEGHPDNTTPALTGGLVTSVLSGRRVYYVKQEIKNDLRFVAMIPDFELSTHKARAALPETIARRDGVFNLSRAALMSVSLYSGNYQNLRCAADDRLHQPYRLGLIPGGAEVMESCYNYGAYASFISGAGSTIMAIVDASIDDFADMMRRRLDETGMQSWQVKVLEIDNTGTVIERV